MNKSVFEKNIAFFRSRFPSLSEKVKNEIAFFSSFNSAEDLSTFLKYWKIEKARNASFTLKALSNDGTTISVHSAYNPVREAASKIALKKDECGAARNLVFLGFGLGYAPIEAARLFPEKRFVLFSPLVSHFLAALCVTDFSALFAVKNLVLPLSCSLSDVVALVGEESFSSSVFFDTQYSADEKEYFDGVAEIVKRNLEKERINAATLSRFAPLWRRNIEANLPTALSLRGVNSFRNHLRGGDALVLAAGPSLEDILPHLKRLKEKMCVIAVETALKAVLEAGVEPHFIILTDPQYAAYNHIRFLKSPSSVLVTQVCAVPPVFRFPCREIVVAHAYLPILREETAPLEAKGYLGSGGSVSASAWELAKLLGASRIFLSGLDLSFPASHAHFRGATGEKTLLLRSFRLSSYETLSTHSLFSAPTFLLKNYAGDEVLTDARMRMFAWWFESTAAKEKKVATYNLSAKSLEISGIPFLSLSSVLDGKV